MKDVLILEDDKFCVDALRVIIESLDKDIRIHMANHVLEAEKIKDRNKIDLFLIDICLDEENYNDRSGITFARIVRKTAGYERTYIMFITGMEDYELTSYQEFRYCRFIRKPIDEEVVRLELLETLNDIDTFSKNNKKIIFNIDGIDIPVNVSDIFYIEKMGRDIVVYGEEEVICVLKRCSIKDVLKIADTPDLIYCNRSYVINRDYINCISERGRYVEMCNGKSFEVGRTRKMRFLKEVEYGASI